MTKPQHRHPPAPYTAIAKAIPNDLHRRNMYRLMSISLLTLTYLGAYSYTADAADVAVKPAAEKAAQQPSPQALKKAAEAASKDSEQEKSKAGKENSDQQSPDQKSPAATETKTKPASDDQNGSDNATPAAPTIPAPESEAAPETVMQSEPVYLDDRSTPQKLIESYYNAINRKEYARAFTYYAQGQYGEDFDKYSQGYEGTRSVKIKLGTTQPDPGAGQIYWSLPIAIEATQDDGKTQVYTGCYTISMSSPAMQTVPPFKPMSIMAGTLSKSPLELDKSVPEECGAP